MNKEKLTRAGLEPGGRRFKSRSSKFFFVHPNLSKICTQSISLVVYYMTFKFHDMGPKMLHYARQFADFNIGDQFDLIQLARATIFSGCLMCAQTCFIVCAVKNKHAKLTLQQVCVHIKQPS